MVFLQRADRGGSAHVNLHLLTAAKSFPSAFLSIADFALKRAQLLWKSRNTSWRSFSLFALGGPCVLMQMNCM